MEELTLTPQKAAETLVCAGFQIGYDKLRKALIQGKVPFGFAIESGSDYKGKTKYEFVVFKKDLKDFILAHGGVWDAGS